MKKKTGICAEEKPVSIFILKHRGDDCSCPQGNRRDQVSSQLPEFISKEQERWEHRGEEPQLRLLVPPQPHTRLHRSQGNWRLSASFSRLCGGPYKKHLLASDPNCLGAY